MCDRVCESRGPERSGEPGRRRSRLPVSHRALGRARQQRTSLPTTDALPPPARPPVSRGPGERNFARSRPGEAPRGQCACALPPRPGPAQEENGRRVRRRGRHRREAGVALSAGAGPLLAGRRPGRKVVRRDPGLRRLAGRAARRYQA